ncbi:MAG: holin-like protein [Desulfovibrionales bacterium]|jgi:holin-like protein|nr:holin-like protein [Desulfovibrionales bacterium]
MTTHALSVQFRRKFYGSRLAQIALLYFVWLASSSLARAVGLPIPGGIVGMAVLYALLASKAVSLRSLRRGVQWYLGEMLLFFVPAVLSFTAHPEFFGLLGLKILAVILAGTVSVMCVTALTVDLFYRWRTRHELTESVLE